MIEKARRIVNRAFGELRIEGRKKMVDS